MQLIHLQQFCNVTYWLTDKKSLPFHLHNNSPYNNNNNNDRLTAFDPGQPG